MKYLVLVICAYLYGYYEPFLIGSDYGVGSCLEVYSLALDCCLASLIVLERNGLYNVGQLAETMSRLYRPYWYTSIFYPKSKHATNVFVPFLSIFVFSSSRLQHLSAFFFLCKFLHTHCSFSQCSLFIPFSSFLKVLIALVLPSFSHCFHRRCHHRAFVFIVLLLLPLLTTVIVATTIHHPHYRLVFLIFLNIF